MGNVQKREMHNGKRASLESGTESFLRKQEMKEIKASVREVRKGRHLFVREVEIGSEEPRIQLLFQHGLCATEEQFTLILDELSKSDLSIRCVLYDGVGCNKSPPSDNYHIDEQVSDLRAIVENYIVADMPTVIVTHSYGTTLVLKLLEQRPMDQLCGLVLLGTAVRCEHLPYPDGGLAIMTLPLFVLRCMQPILTNGFVKQAVHPCRPELQEVIRKASGENDMGVAQSLHRATKWASAESLAVIRDTDVLLLHGVDDQVLPVECSQFLVNRIPNAKLHLLDRASHLIPLECPEGIASEIIIFLRTKA